ncbi:MAG: PIN domain-containing protein [Verrucomicrobiota bacterium]
MRVYGIDTSVFVRLLTGDPLKEYEKTVAALENLLNQGSDVKIAVSNIVMGEAYFVLQHHYGIPRRSAREAMLSVFESGFVEPLNGKEIFEMLTIEKGAGLMDRLIAQDYYRQNVLVLTRDFKMAALRGCKLLAHA